MNRRGHNLDIAKIFYENKKWRHIGSGQLSYFILTDAMLFSIDHSNPNKNKKLYKNLGDNLKKTPHGKHISLPSFSDLASLGAGFHRYYNHQGFYYDYTVAHPQQDPNEIKRKREWRLRRDEILIPCVGAAFNLQPQDARTIIIAILAYYIHMASDLRSGKTDQMVPINTFDKLLLDFYNALIRNLNADMINQYSAFTHFLNEIERVAFSEIWKNLSTSQPQSAHIYFLRYLEKHIPDIIQEFTTKRPKDISYSVPP